MTFLIQQRAVGAASIVGVLAIWEAASGAQLINRFFLPPPSTLVASMLELYLVGYPEGTWIGTHVARSLGRVLAGFAGACALAIPLGVLAGYIPALDAMTRPIAAFGRSIAAISLLPLFIAWFGIGETSKIALIGLASFWVLFTYTVAAVKFVDPLLLRAAQSIDTPHATIFFRVILPAASPRIFTGLKVALQVSFMVIIAAEMIATVVGLGALIQEARTTFRTDITLCGMAIIGAIGYALSGLLDRLERIVLPWRAGVEERS
jgi:ABC-type nitrate/sulfonate/bicarbonate transport system permease component